MDHGGAASLLNESRDGPSEAETIDLCKENLNVDLQGFRLLTQNRQEQPPGAHQIEQFYCDRDEIVAWIIEKDVVISSDKFGRCVDSVQTFQRKRLERDLAAIADKIMTFEQEAARLCRIHLDRADQISAKRQEIVNNWERLSVKAKELKLRSDERYHQFHSEFRDLVSWIHDMKAIIAADKLEYVADAVDLLPLHHERKGEIDAREGRFRATIEAGRLLIENDHWFAAEVSEKLIALANEKQYLMTLWEERCMLCEQCIEFLSDGPNNPSKEAEENPPPLSDEQLNPASPDSIPVFDGMSQEQRKEFALELIALARIELSEQFYDGAKYSLEVAEHCFPMEESKKMLEQLAILEQTSRTETNVYPLQFCLPKYF